MKDIKIFYGKKILLEDFNWLDNAGVVVSPEGKIIAIEKIDHIRREYSGRIVEFECGTIIPGLLNAHTHLELSHLKGKVQASSSFANWLQEIALHRIMFDREQAIASARESIKAMIAQGVTTIADVVSENITPLLLAEYKHLRKFYFFEIAGWTEEQATNMMNRLTERIRGLEQYNDTMTFYGISPHAPYSVSESLLRNAVAFSNREHCLIMIHLAESPEEDELIRSGQGKLYELFDSFGVLPEDWKPPGCSPTQFLYDLGMLSNDTLVVHFNYPSDEDIQLVKNSGCSVVYCPGSHRFFKHTRHPLPTLLKEGINVCIGTDSLASNEELDMFREMRIVAEEFSELSAPQILSLATTNPARALKLQNETGKIKKGLSCDLAVLISNNADEITLEMISGKKEQEFSVLATVLAGNVVYNSAV
ncbi:amidohydrolase family protein [Candidatus Sumerlaeota bacterium]|nr:amidohydrolase family protein [Candidatus Sumerlaeota bacterium]